MSDYEYSDDGNSIVYSDDEDMEDDGNGSGDQFAINVSNTFYEAEDIKRSDPNKALTVFMKVVEMEREARPDQVTWRFKALEHIVGLHFRLGNSEEMIAAYEELLGCLDQVTRNECNDTINNILDEISVGSIDNGTAPVSLSRMYEITLDVLKSANNERLWFNTNLKLGKMHLENRDYSQVAAITEALHSTLNTGASKDDGNWEAYLLEVYALEIAMYSATRQSSKLREIYPKTRALSAAVQDPRIMGSIHEAGGKLAMAEENWSEAYDEFFEGFRNYQEAGNPRAKVCLKYVVLANLLAGKDINPFDSREAKVFQDDKEIQAMIRLRSAFESWDAKGFEAILRDESLGITKDEFIMRYVSNLLRNIRSQVLIKMIQPYQRVLTSFLASEVNVSTKEVESILVELILDEKINARLDEKNAILEMVDSNGKLKSHGTTIKYDALNDWTNRLSGLLDTL